jgi:hypothetical protein
LKHFLKVTERKDLKMADMRGKMKKFWMKSMQAVGNTASSIASNTRYKVNEMNLQNRRREILNDFSSKAYALWMKGEKLPDELAEMMEELKGIDERLNDMRAERYAGKLSDTARDMEEDGEPEAQEEVSSEENAEDTPEGNPEEGVSSGEAETAFSVSDTPTGETIHGMMDSLFDEAPSVDQMAGRVNSSLDKMNDQLRKFREGTGESFGQDTSDPSEKR